MDYLLKNKRIHMVTVFLSIMLVFISILLSAPMNADAKKNVKEKSQLSHGVDYKKMNYTKGGAKGRVNLMEMDVSDAFTEVQFGKPQPLDNLATVRDRANSYDKKYNQIIGAINANFWKVKPGWSDTTRPVHLISEDNRLVYAGYVNKGNNNLINEPIAFGMDKNGEGLIDRYNVRLTYTFNGKNQKISHTNRKRAKNNTILYTSDFYKDNTDTNEYGTEVVLKGPKNAELTLSSSKEFEVTSIRKEKDKKPTEIADDAVVLSGNGKASKRLQKMKKGDTVDINIGMDEKWQDSEFMLAGGPQLVKNGKVNISMNENSAQAQALTSRTVVGVDKSQDKVFFVTVDTSISDGMNMKHMAKLMKDLGADTTLNLDGGGSTTMALRPENGSALQVANKLQDGSERGVSGILMAADTEPERIFRDVSARDDLYDGIKWAKENDAIAGYDDNTFKPDNKLSRQHGALMFTRTFDLEKPDASRAETLFTDIQSTHDYAEEIAAVSEADIFTGNDKQQFSPTNHLKREQMASTIVRAYDWEDSATGEKDIRTKNVDPAHRDSVQILADKGVTKELDDFRPGETVTRGQFANFLHRAEQVE